MITTQKEVKLFMMYQYNGIIFKNANPKHADGTKAWSQICRICVSNYKIKRSMLENV